MPYRASPNERVTEPLTEAKVHWDTEMTWCSIATPASVSASKLCSQPIDPPPPPLVPGRVEPSAPSKIRSSDAAAGGGVEVSGESAPAAILGASQAAANTAKGSRADQIGRASCRERV